MWLSFIAELHEFIEQEIIILKDTSSFVAYIIHFLVKDVRCIFIKYDNIM